MSQIFPYGKQNIDEEDIRAVTEVLTSEFLTQGPAVDRFERTFAEFIGVKYAVAISNGTAGLHIAYLAAGIGPGDAVIVPANTFAATANAALYCGATPVFCDINPITTTMDPKSLREAISLAEAKGLRVKLIVPVQFGGRPADMKSIYNIAQSIGALVIEDACHAVGAQWRDDQSSPWSMVGKLPGTAMSVFSFHPVKHLTTGEGGIVTTEDEGFANKLRLLRSHGIERNATNFQHLDRATSPDSRPNPWYHEMQVLGLNYRLCDLQAALGYSQCQRLAQFVKRRREIADLYRQQLPHHLGLPPVDDSCNRHSYHLFQIKSAHIKKNRALYMNRLKELSVGTQVHYIPVPWHPYYTKHKVSHSVDLSNAIEHYESVLSIPMYPALQDSDVQKISSAIAQVEASF